MDVILHVGGHRTATTTFQDYVLRNQGALADRNIAVWEPVRMRGGLANGITGRLGQDTPVALRKALRSTGLMRIKMDRMERVGFDRLLVSEQNMIGSLRDNLQSVSLYGEAEPRLARFVGAFGAKCCRVVIGIRSYEGYWASALAYALPGGMAMPDAARLDRIATQPRRWRRVIEEIARTFPHAQCLVLPFEAMAGHPEVQLSAMLGEQMPVLDDARRWLHPSPGRDMLRRVLCDRGERAAAAAIPAGDGRWQPFGPDQIAAMQAQYAEDLAWLADGADGHATLSVRPAPDRRDTRDAWQTWDTWALGRGDGDGDRKRTDDGYPRALGGMG